MCQTRWSPYLLYVQSPLLTTLYTVPTATLLLFCATIGSSLFSAVVLRSPNHYQTSLVTENLNQKEVLWKYTCVLMSLNLKSAYKSTLFHHVSNRRRPPRPETSSRAQLVWYGAPTIGASTGRLKSPPSKTSPFTFTVTAKPSRSFPKVRS